MKVAMLIPDNRDEFGHYDEPVPLFGPAPTALLEGMSSRGRLTGACFSCPENPYVLRKSSQTISILSLLPVNDGGGFAPPIWVVFWRFERSYMK